MYHQGYEHTKNTLLTTHWQLAPSLDSQAVQGVDDIHQCIDHILSTMKGTDVLRPEFGSDHFQYIDQPEDIAIPNIVREITLALQRWENASALIQWTLMAWLRTLNL